MLRLIGERLGNKHCWGETKQVLILLLKDAPEWKEHEEANAGAQEHLLFISEFSNSVAVILTMDQRMNLHSKAAEATPLLRHCIVCLFQ